MPILCQDTWICPKKTGATIVYGPTAEASFDTYVAKDREELRVGNVTIQVLHTPGHTMESTTYLLKDESGEDLCDFYRRYLIPWRCGAADWRSSRES